MLDHILTEKIEFATSGTFEAKTKEKVQVDEEGEYGVFSEHITARDGLHIVETTEFSVSRDPVEIVAKIKVESPKALLITLDSSEEFWIPKSTIHSEYDVSEKTKSQKFIVDKWIIEKTKILNMFTGDGIKVKVGTPLKVEKRLNREKYRAERYELAEDIINIIDSLKETPEIEEIE